MGHKDFALAQELCFFVKTKTWAYKFTRYSISIHFKNINLKYLQYLLDNNIFFIKGSGYFASRGKIGCIQRWSRWL